MEETPAADEAVMTESAEEETLADEDVLAEEAALDEAPQAQADCPDAEEAPGRKRC